MVGSGALRAIRIRLTLLTVVVAMIAMWFVGVVVTRPAHAANTCVAFTTAPSTSSVAVYFKGYGSCTQQFEQMRVHITGYFRYPNYYNPHIALSWTSSACINSTRCPYPGGAYYFQRTVSKPASCRIYWTVVTIDVMYRGEPVWHNGVDQAGSGETRVSC